MIIDPTASFFFVLLCGLAFGSLITLLTYRLPLGEDVVVKPSRCPKCETKLQFIDLLPIVSWLFTQGRCRYCHAPISLRYPLTELVTVTVFLLLYGQYGLTAQGVLLALMWTALMVMMIVDLEHTIIPDSVHVALIILGVGYHVLMGTPAEDVVGGFFLGGFIGLSLHHGYRLIRKRDGLGFGDVKFLAVAGLWLGMKPIVPFLFFAGVFGIVTGLLWRVLGKGPIFPFGPALALSLFLSVIMPQLSNWFWNIGQLAR